MESNELHDRWQEGEQAYQREREAYFPTFPAAAQVVGGAEARVSPRLATPEVLARLAELRAEAKRLRDQWYRSLFGPG